MATQLSFDELGTPLHEVTFVVLDLETTGGRPAHDRITEIGAVKVRGGQLLGEFSTLVNPGRPIPPQVASLTGITDAMVADAPELATVLPAFLEFAAGDVLVAHNARFDLGFLRAACSAHGYARPDHRVLCTVRLARHVLSRRDAPSCKLSALATLFGARTPEHRALHDARATVDVLHALLERVGSLGVHSIDELVAFQARVSPQQRRKRSLAAHLPAAPGVYLFRGPNDEVLYIGTASNLRNRVQQYFTGSETRSRMREMVTLATSVAHVECATALEAEVREQRLLAAHRPSYNRRAKNPHRSWWIALTSESFPRLSVVRRERPGALGPFGSRRSAARTAATLTAAVGLRSCTQRIAVRSPDGSPCAEFDLGRCGAPCAGKQDAADYAPAARAITELVTGSGAEPLRATEREIARLSAAHHFERAAQLRDELAALVRAVDRAHRMSALARITEMVAAAPDGAGGWEFAVIRYGRLAAAGTARRGTAPMPIVEALTAAAETVLPGDGPLRGAAPDEVAALLRWLDRPGTRLVRATEGWAEPAVAAGPWREWLELAAEASTLERTPRTMEGADR
ncbi:DEDD exonuclease domain-containing protein [Haloechinothrix sp. LS1_15]|uniref:DEDD exonuclease domain-containing protein n=1 Tax=Haloechinothrix sp. LS1_15 TaxID=2652248 RepID=UPI00294733B0|nr:DEDD exonuclease domain-containing protein [Haloechinothrix sp. LS1_15]MDV6012711.1 DEDD exonuclease domain-containing protein [Haloechinothrix sp. LS1_15]